MSSYWYPHVPEVAQLNHLLGALQRRCAPDYDPARPPPETVLDLGCGPDASWCLEQAQLPGWEHTRFTGFDLVAVRLPLTLLPPSLSARLAFAQGNFLHHLPFPEDSFDFVRVSLISMGVPEHKWSDVCDQVAHVLKPGGFAFFSDMNPPQLTPLPPPSLPLPTSAQLQLPFTPPVRAASPLSFFPNDSSSIASSPSNNNNSNNSNNSNNPHGSNITEPPKLSTIWLNILEKRFLPIFPLSTIPSAIALAFNSLHGVGPCRFYFPARPPVRPEAQDPDLDKQYLTLLSLSSRSHLLGRHPPPVWALAEELISAQNDPHGLSDPETLRQLDQAVRVILHATVDFHNSLLPSLVQGAFEHSHPEEKSPLSASRVPSTPNTFSSTTSTSTSSSDSHHNHHYSHRPPPKTPPPGAPLSSSSSSRATSFSSASSPPSSLSQYNAAILRGQLQSQIKKALKESSRDLLPRAGISALVMSRFNWCPEMDKKAISQYERNADVLRQELDRVVMSSTSLSPTSPTYTPNSSINSMHARNTSWALNSPSATGLSNSIISTSSSSNSVAALPTSSSGSLGTSRSAEIARMLRSTETELRATKKRLDPYYDPLSDSASNSPTNLSSPPSPSSPLPYDAPHAIGYFELGWNQGIAP